MSTTDLLEVGGACVALLGFCAVTALRQRRRFRLQYDRPRRWFDRR